MGYKHCISSLGRLRWPRRCRQMQKNISKTFSILAPTVTYQHRRLLKEYEELSKRLVCQLVERYTSSSAPRHCLWFAVFCERTRVSRSTSPSTVCAAAAIAILFFLQHGHQHSGSQTCQSGCDPCLSYPPYLSALLCADDLSFPPAAWRYG